MGSACCVAARDKTLPERIGSEALHRNIRYSPSWSFRWENQGRVIGEVDNQINQLSQRSSGDVGLESKDQRDVEMRDVSNGGSPMDNFRMPNWQRLPVREGTAMNLRTPASDASVENNLSTRVNDLRESSVVANLSVSKPSFSVASTSSSSTSKLDSLPSQSEPPPTDSGPSKQANCSPGEQLVRQVSETSPNNSPSEGRQSFVISMCSNEHTMGSQGGPSDILSMRAFSELMESSQRERWSSFDSESWGYSQGKLSRSNSRLSRPPSLDMQTCGVCSKLLTERSSWSSQKIIGTSDILVVAVLVCGHVFHGECLEHMTGEKDRYDPGCPLCLGGEKQVCKMYGKAASRMEADLKGKNNRISRNRVVDSDLDDDDENWKGGGGRQGKSVVKLGPSSSMKTSFGKPFLKRHFSFGLNRSRSLSVNDSPSPRRKKGFLSRYKG